MFKLALLLATLAPTQNEVAKERAADVICGETGNDQVMADHVARVIDNRMRLRAGSRASKALAVLNERNAFASSCKKHGKKPTEWHVFLAKTLIEGDARTLMVKPWMTSKVLRFTDRPPPCAKAKKRKKVKVKRRCGDAKDPWVAAGHRLVGRIGRMNFYEE